MSTVKNLVVLVSLLVGVGSNVCAANYTAPLDGVAIVRFPQYGDMACEWKGYKEIRLESGDTTSLPALAQFEIEIYSRSSISFKNEFERAVIVCIPIASMCYNKDFLKGCVRHWIDQCHFEIISPSLFYECDDGVPINTSFELLPDAEVNFPIGVDRVKILHEFRTPENCN
jgi:hypothetical protein